MNDNDGDITYYQSINQSINLSSDNLSINQIDYHNLKMRLRYRLTVCIKAKKLVGVG
jgi:hypothetical protein